MEDYTRKPDYEVNEGQVETAEHFEAPPVMPGEMPNSWEQSTWPKVLGIVCIVFGSLGMLGGLFGAFGALMMGVLSGSEMMSEVGDQDMDAMMLAMKHWMPAMVATNVLRLIAAGVLLASGIMMLSKRRGCPTWVMWYVGLQSVFAVSSGVVSALMQREIMAAMLASNGGPGGGPAMGGFMGAFSGIAGLITVVWYLALPVFLLIWFRRPVIKEEIANGWGG